MTSARTNWALTPPPQPGQLPLTRAQVLTAERLWGGKNNRDAWQSQWEAISTIADDLWNTPSANTRQIQRLWVTLVYAIGNFKRQGNTGIFPLPAPWSFGPRSSAVRRGPTLTIPAGGGYLKISSTASTLRLAGTRGLGSVPTGSTVLTALWPKHHVICDKRDLQVAVALLAHNGASIISAANARTHLLAPDWAEYKWFHQLLTSEAKRLRLSSPTILERALFVAYGFAPPSSVTSLTWAQWGRRLVANWP
jgi:hypothetical protein